VPADPLLRAWPLFGLRLKVDQVELRLPTDPELAELAEVAADGVHDPSIMPFLTPWTRREPPQLQRATLQFHWGERAAWTPERWSLNMAVFVDGVVVGSQGIGATAFAVVRTVGTGSWLGQRFQGRGIGTAMRTAVLALAFEGLGAVAAESGAFGDNPASLAVSRKLGYRPNGVLFHDREGVRASEQRLLLTREEWHAVQRPPVSIEGLEACLELFGATVPG
jgi:RimJ/RimL family protein N-acetyltransferase